MTKAEIIGELIHPKNQNVMSKYTKGDFERMDIAALKRLILETPGYVWDTNLPSDLEHQQEILAFRYLLNWRREQWANRVRLYDSLSRNDLLSILMDLRNRRVVPINYFLSEPPVITGLSDLELRALCKKLPELLLPGEYENVPNPDFWVPHPHQIEHVTTLLHGLRHPLHASRLVLDGSLPGSGKTISTIIQLIELGCSNVLIVCPDTIIAKWDDALGSLGLFNYRITTYNAVKGTQAKAAVQWSRYKVSGKKGYVLEDNEWMQVRKSFAGATTKNFFDWSFLPAKRPNGQGLGGTCVVWDEVHHAKATGASIINECFTDFLDYLSSLAGGFVDPAKYKGDLSTTKYVRSICLTGSMIENIKDMPYLLKGLGFIPHATKAAMSDFVRRSLLPHFKELIGEEDWRPWFGDIVDSEKKLLFFFRTVGKRKRLFSQIPDPMDYLLYRAKATRGFYPEDRNDFVERVLIHNFRDMMGVDYRRDMEALNPTEMLKAYLKKLAKDPTIRALGIGAEAALAVDFNNNLTFQPLQIQDKDVEQFKKINRDITKMLQDIEAGIQSQKNVLGQMQKSISKFEILMLTAFTEMARYALNLNLANGAKPSVVVAMQRTASIRHLAWRIEAILELEQIALMNPTPQQVEELRLKLINEILRAQAEYAHREEELIRYGRPLHVKSSFTKYTGQDLAAMGVEDLLAEHNKWYIYLNINLFKHVCIYVGDFGVAKDSKNLDMESDDMNDMIRESKPMKPDEREDAKTIFQANRRRVFLTIMSMGREGIDLMDLSPGGMNPRVMLASPGVIANHLIQMKKRIVRVGQTSETYTLIGFVGDFGGVPSWHARIMKRISEKASQIQILHEGGVTEDIDAKIKQDDGTLFKMLMSIMHSDEMSVIDDNARGSDVTAVEKVLKDSLEGKSKQNYQSTADKTQSYATISKSIDITSRVNNLPLNTGNLYTCIFGDKIMAVVFDPRLIANDRIRLESGLLNLLTTTYIVDPTNYMSKRSLHKIARDQDGYLINREDFKVMGVSNERFVADLIASTQLYPTVFESADQDFELSGFNPVLSVPRLAIIIENPQRLTVGPLYPILGKISADLLSDDLKMELVEGANFAGRTFNGEDYKIMTLYFAILYVYKQDHPQLYKAVTVVDRNQFRKTYMEQFGIRYAIEGDTLVISAIPSIFKSIGYILASNPRLLAAIQSGTLFDLTSFRSDTTHNYITVRREFAKEIRELLDFIRV